MSSTPLKENGPGVESFSSGSSSSPKELINSNDKNIATSPSQTKEQQDEQAQQQTHEQPILLLADGKINNNKDDTDENEVKSSSLIISEQEQEEQKQKDQLNQEKNYTNDETMVASDHNDDDDDDDDGEIIENESNIVQRGNIVMQLVQESDELVNSSNGRLKLRLSLAQPDDVTSDTNENENDSVSSTKSPNVVNDPISNNVETTNDDVALNDTDENRTEIHKDEDAHESNDDDIMEDIEIDSEINSEKKATTETISNKMKKSPKKSDAIPKKPGFAKSTTTEVVAATKSFDDDNHAMEDDDPIDSHVAAAKELLAVSVASVVNVTAPAPAPASIILRESFLSDSLTEEERRTRTRYIPTVEGMHSLCKQEVKHDIALARTLLAGEIGNSKNSLPTNNNTTTTITGSKHLKSASGAYHTNDTTMSGYDDIIMDDADLSKDGIKIYDDEKVADAGLRRLQVVPNIDIVVPSTAFVPPPQLPIPPPPPPPPTTTSSSSHVKDESEETKSDNRTAGIKRAAPGEVESITAFNPPRLPESVSRKKQHRMLKWQRRPADMDSDIVIYKQVVQKQRDELKCAEGELQRLRTIDNHLRRHFLLQIKSINEEMALINTELATDQNKCVKATEWYLPTSRARGRNDGKPGCKAMKDIIHGLRRLDAELVNKRGIMEIDPIHRNDKPNHVPTPPPPPRGVGGVSAVSFTEWNRSTNITPNKVASAWIVPNDKVILPTFGSIEGVAVKFFPYSPLDVSEPPSTELFPAKVGIIQKLPTPNTQPNLPWMPTNNNNTMSQPPALTTSGTATPSIRKIRKKGEFDKTFYHRMIGPRFAVKLPFGVGFFAVNSVVSNEDASTYTNERLAERWKGMLETAAVVAPTIDVGAMITMSAKEVNDAIHEYERSIDAEDSTNTITSRDILKSDNDNNKKTKGSHRVVPVGSNLLPTVGARGAFLHKASMAELNLRCNKLYHGAKGVLGRRDNQGVTTEIRELEDQNVEYLQLQAKVLQLRNQLYRQRRIRVLNEKAYNATKERASRVEALVAEMRTDLKTLKGRLDDEIQELGISDDTAERILTSYYKSLEINQKSSNTMNKATAAGVGHRRINRITSDNDNVNDPSNDEMATEDHMQVDTEPQ